MAQLTLYLPESLIDRLRQEAAAAHKSVSAHVRDKLSRDTPSRDELDSLFGTCDLGEPPEDPPPDEVEGL